MADRDPDLMLPRPVRGAMHLVWRFTRGMTLGVRGIVRDETGAVLLVRHTYTPGWHLPGGGVEPGETGLAALTRELREEAGVAMLAPPRLHGAFFNRAVSNRDHVLVYVIDAFTRDDSERRAREIAQARFFEPGALPDNATPGTRRRLAEVIDGAAVVETW